MSLNVTKDLVNACVITNGVDCEKCKRHERCKEYQKLLKIEKEEKENEVLHSNQS